MSKDLSVCFKLLVIIQFYVIYFFVQTVSALGGDSPFSDYCVPLMHCDLFVSSSFRHYYRLILCIPCLSPTMSHFFEDPWLLLLENGIRNQYGDTGYAHCCWYELILKWWGGVVNDLESYR